jgi:hypothetical protein
VTCAPLIACLITKLSAYPATSGKKWLPTKIFFDGVPKYRHETIAKLVSTLNFTLGSPFNEGERALIFNYLNDSYAGQL